MLSIFSGRLDRVLRLCWSLLQDPRPDLVTESTQEHRVHHGELHALDALPHGLVHLCLCPAHQIALIGSSVVWLDFVTL
jgi:hypothetical protein